MTAQLLPHRRHNTQATSVAMRFWARSIGDRNPAFTDEAYSGETGGSFMAHPCWLYSVQDTIVAADAKGRLPIVAGTEWTFDRPVVLGDTITTRACLIEERRVSGQFAGDTPVQRVQVSYHDAIGARVARAVSTLFLVDPDAARKRGHHADWKRYRYSEPELLAIEAAYDSEEVQGAKARYWEDLTVGDEIASIVRGPMSSEESVLFIGATRPCLGASAFARERRAGNVAGFIHPRSGIWETYAAGLVDDDSARQMGYPAAHDIGLDRIAQMASLVTNWVGDNGRLLRLDARLLRPHMLGDTSRLEAGVSSAELLQGTSGGSVQLEIRCVNQRNEVTAVGSATASLPCKENV
ncbi:MaoC family dehydratase N-terminal domain-containing protein [soil metagenome]